jgi:hypothetical protein
MDQTEGPLETLAEGADYALAAGSDRARYVLRYKPDRMTADLKGEDAARFRVDYATVTTQFPDWRADQALAQLWDQGGYSWLATEDGD